MITRKDSAETRTILGVVAHAAGDLRVDQMPIPIPSQDEALVDIAYGGICGSDLHYWIDGAAGESILREPLLLGHEVVGTVAVAAADGSGPGVGARVAVHPATPGPGDGSRYPDDSPNLSPGATYLGSAVRLPHRSGAFADQVALPSRMLRPLPDTLSLRDAALIEPAAVAWHAVSRAGRLSGKRVLVVGSGPIGALVVAVLKLRGAGEIIAVDMYEQPLEIARELGAHRTILATDADAIAAVDADVAIESSGSPRGLASAIRGTTRGGVLVMVGLLPSGEQPVPIALAIIRELTLRGSFRFNDEIDDVIAALAAREIDLGPVVTHEFAASDALQAFEVARDSARSGKVLLRFESAG